MLFNSLQYLLFLPLVVVCFWLSKKRYRNLLLLAASYFFYMNWFAPYCLLLAALTGLNFALGLGIEKVRSNKSLSKAFLVAGLFLNLGCLVFFKYTNFLLDCAHNAIKYLGYPLDTAPLTFQQVHIIVPLAISFFVFEFVHYLGDIYSGCKPILNPIRFALFTAFFPSQIAGPIKRFEDFDMQISLQNKFSSPMFLQGINLILEGMFKKVALGDNLVPIVEKGFSSIQYLAPLDAWVAALAFTFEIYYDFSGYTDIGRGSAMLLGIHLPENFNKPYFSTSLIEFWRRWHMSLSSWLRDYLYKPLGGSKTDEFSRNRNLLITMLLGGLWHGASWHFVIWGAFHGTGLIINHSWRKLFSKKGTGAGNTVAGHVQKVASSLAGTALTFFFVIVGWILFRADSFESAMQFYEHMFILKAGTFESGVLWQAFITSTLPAAFMLYASFHIWQALVKYFKGAAETDSLSTNYGWQFWLSPQRAMLVSSYFVCAVLILCLASKKAAPFIYFQF